MELALASGFEPPVSALQQQWSDVDRVLSLLQQLCEGHQRDWQNLLRHQPGQMITVRTMLLCCAA